MNGLDEEQMGPQTFLYGCELKSGKEVAFNPEDDDFEHQLDLRMVCVDQSTKDELHIVEVEGQDTEGQKVKAVLASLKPSTLPSVCLGGFAITPPAVFRLKAGSGPIHISGQHLVMMGGDQSFDENDDDEEEEEEELQTSKKRPASAPALKSQKKMKMEDSDEEDDDEDEDDDDEMDTELEESPVKAKKTPSKAQTPSKTQTPKPQGSSKPQTATPNGKVPKANTPASKQAKTPTQGGKNGQTPTSSKKHSPKVLTLPEIKAKLVASIEKGGKLPKNQPKFESYVKNCLSVKGEEIVAELWKWRQSLEDSK